jgi:hypothetical protein
LNDRGANQNVSNSRLTLNDSDKPEYALPGARYKSWQSAATKLERSRRRTFSMNPQKRTSGFPFGEDTALEKPLRRSLVMSITRDVVVSRRIRRREPSDKVLT